MNDGLIGQTLGNYRIVERLGRGGMATVYKAYQTSLERYVAVKIIHPQLVEQDKQFIKRFQREAKAIASLRHPNIVQIFDFGVENGMPYMVMEYLEGHSLKAELKALTQENQLMPLDEVQRIIQGVASALGYAHQQGLTHRDVKPDNIMVTTKGNVILTDFGIAKIVGGTQYTATGAVMGTPAYMSPEQGFGERGDERSDIYALGVILYEMVTGHLPFSADTPIAVIMKHISDPLPMPRELNPELPPIIETVLFKALAKQPQDRYQRAEDMAHALDQAIKEELSKPAPTLPSQPAAAQAPTAVHTPPPSQTPTAVPAAETVAAAAKEAPSAPAEKPAAPKWVWPLVGVLLGGIVVVAILLAAGVLQLSSPETAISREPQATQAALAPEASPASETERSNPPQEEPEPAVPPPARELPPEQFPEFSNIIFADQFEGTLNPEWNWVRRDEETYSLSEAENRLRIYIRPGQILSDEGDDGVTDSLVLLSAPEGNWELTTQVYFEPYANFQFAGLVVYQDRDTLLQFGRAFCDVPEPCVGNGIYFDNVQNTEFIGPNFATPVDDPGMAFLKLRREGEIYTGFYSGDGENWQLIGEHNAVLVDERIGLLAGHAIDSENFADFEFFTLEMLGTPRFVALSGSDEGSSRCTEPTSPCKTIAQAVAVAGEGDAVLIAGGVYPENILITQKRVTLVGGFQNNGPEWIPNAAETIINGGRRGRVFTIRNDSRVIINNLIIRDGTAPEAECLGGGVTVQNSQLLLTRVIVDDNEATCGPGVASAGGGIDVSGGERGALLIVENSIIQNNRAGEHGGAVNAFGATVELRNVLVQSNTYNSLMLVDSHARLIHTTISRNDIQGPAVTIQNADVHILNSILWDNPAGSIAFESGNLNVMFSIVEGGWEGEGNMSIDPLFVDPDGGVFNLRPQSPAIDAGTLEGAPPFDFEGSPRRDGYPDIGFDEVE